MANVGVGGDGEATKEGECKYKNHSYPLLHVLGRVVGCQELQLMDIKMGRMGE